MEYENKIQAILRAGRTDSRAVADMLKKRHCDVLRDIERLDCTQPFRRANFGLGYHWSEQGKVTPHIIMTSVGFGFLLMGYNGKRLAAIKETYLHMLLTEREEVREQKLRHKRKAPPRGKRKIQRKEMRA